MGSVSYIVHTRDDEDWFVPQLAIYPTCHGICHGIYRATCDRGCDLSCACILFMSQW